MPGRNTSGLRRGGGRVKGVPNKVSGQLKTMILRALDEAGGVEYLKARAIDTPGPFLALIGKVLPTTITDGDGQPLFPPGGVMFVIQQQAGADNQT